MGTFFAGIAYISRQQLSPHVPNVMKCGIWMSAILYIQTIRRSKWLAKIHSNRNRNISSVPKIKSLFCQYQIVHLQNICKKSSIRTWSVPECHFLLTVSLLMLPWKKWFQDMYSFLLWVLTLSVQYNKVIKQIKIIKTLKNTRFECI